MPSVRADLIEAVRRDGTPRIDVVVATHRHFDHISGFDSTDWDGVSVGEVWMPWTEERGVPAADALRTKQKRAAEALSARFPTADTRVGWLAMNSMSNKGAEQTLLTGFSGDPDHRYLPAVERHDRSFNTDLLPGVRVHALGPSHDPAIVATLDPPKGKYFPPPPDENAANPAAAAGATAGPPTVARIFPDRYRIEPARYAATYARLADHADMVEVQRRAEDDFLGAAAALEDAINGTSLVLVLEVGTRCIVLGGDAEWGTWSEILDDAEWCELLRRTRVYKVSHHGSFNGTPRPFVDDLLPDDAISLVSLRHINKWPSIPRTTLLDALETGARTLVRTDHIATAPGAATQNGDLSIEVNVSLT
jgi:beta-lactamase superfamily II metal-dependent hydrolase